MARLPKHVRDAMAKVIAKPPTLRQQLERLRPEMVRAAQAVLDEWEQDENGEDEELGAGGICDEVADAIAGVIDLPGVTITEGGQDGSDHAYNIVYDDKEAFVVDISPYVYEMGGGLTWKKIPGVELVPDHVDIEPMRRSDVTGDEDD